MLRGPRAVHAPLDEVGRDSRGPEPVRAGVASREEQLARVALQPVAREVQQHQVLRLALGEQVLDVTTHDVGGLVVHDLDVEAAELLVAQDIRQGFRICRRRPEAAQPGIVVLIAGDDQGSALAVHDLALLGVLAQERLDEPILLLAGGARQLKDVTRELEANRPWRFVPTAEPAKHRRDNPHEPLGTHQPHDELAGCRNVEAAAAGRGLGACGCRPDVANVELAQLVAQLPSQGVKALLVRCGLRQGHEQSGLFQ